MKIRQDKEKKQKEELMEFIGSLKQQTSLDTLEDFPEGFAMGPVEEMNLHLKTDDSKNKSTPHVSKIRPSPSSRGEYSSI